MTQLLGSVVLSPAVESFAKVMAGLVVLLLFVGVPCLVVVFLVGLISLNRRDGRRVYEQRATFLSENERAFYHSLHEAVAGRYAIFA